MNDLNALTVDLFLYDLCEGLGRKPEQAEAVKQRFWQRLYPSANGSKPAYIKEKSAYFADYEELLTDKKYEVFPDSVDGFYYPVQLSDTYALQIDSSGEKEQAQQPASPETIKAISTDILENRIRHQHGELGESWLIWGQLSDPNQDAKATAQACYHALTSAQTLDGRKPSWQQGHVGKGHFGGAVLYELQQLDTFLDSKNNNHHVLICLFSAEQTKDHVETTMSKLYRHLIRLFHNRSKVLWLYEESRKLKGQLKEASDTVDLVVSELSRDVQSPRLNLKVLQQNSVNALRVANIYEKQLNYLREKDREISTNLTSYGKRIARMREIDPAANLDVLNRFVTLANEKYLGQIRADVAAFAGAQKPVSNYIQTVQGIIDIERTQNERVLNQTVAIAGVGISAASLAASSIGDRADSLMQAWRPVPANQPPSVANLWLSAALVLTVSLVIGVLAAWVTAALINQKATPS